MPWVVGRRIQDKIWMYYFPSMMKVRILKAWMVSEEVENDTSTVVSKKEMNVNHGITEHLCVN
jgi:hypothetical protein